MPSRDGAPGLPEDLAVVVGVKVNHPGSNDQAGGIYDVLAATSGDAADLGDQSVLDPYVAPKAGGPEAIDDGPAKNPQVELHLTPNVDVDINSLGLLAEVPKVKGIGTTAGSVAPRPSCCEGPKVHALVPCHCDGQYRSAIETDHPGNVTALRSCHHGSQESRPKRPDLHPAHAE
jgi:hypothetical protein